MGVSHLLVPASHPEYPHVAFTSRNKSQTAVDFQFAHSLFDELLNLHVALMKNGRGLPDLLRFKRRLDHPLLPDEIRNIQEAGLRKGFDEPQVKVGWKHVHLETHALDALNPKIVERSRHTALAVDGENVLQGGLLLRPLEPFLHHEDRIALCGDEEHGRLDSPGEVKDVHVLEQERAVQIKAGELCLESCHSLMNFLRRDFVHGASLSGSIQELRLPANRESPAHKGIEDFGKGGLFLVKDHRRLVERSLDIPYQLIGKNSLFRFQDIPYPVPGIPSPADKRNVNLQKHGFVIGPCG